MSDLDICYAKTDLFTSRTVEGKTVLIPAGDLDELDDLFPLNRTGSFLWRRIDGKTAIRELAAGVADEFDIPAKQAEEDVLAFFRQLQDIRAILPTMD
ncbi:MAG: PqqD family protein [Planctomycetes bacterium]|nr:PqqD family protein [Planctomycetota bacterium]